MKAAILFSTIKREYKHQVRVQRTEESTQFRKECTEEVRVQMRETQRSRKSTTDRKEHKDQDGVQRPRGCTKIRRG